MTTSIVASVFDSSLYIPDLKLKRRESALHELVERAHRHGVVRDTALLDEALAIRGRVLPAGIGKGVAVPHARSIAVTEPRIVVARSRLGIDWSAPDGIPVQIAVLVLSPGELSDDLHLEFLGRAVSVLRLQRNRQKILDADRFETVAAVLRDVTP